MTSFTAAELQASPLANAAIASSHCKLYGTTRCWDTLYEAQQTAGGSGFLSTQPYEKRLRDFRVTTIFEGTTEIHSIYPALTLARALGKSLAHRGPLGKLAVLVSFSRARSLRGMRERDDVLRQAVRAAGRSEALLRTLLSRGIRTYGKEIATREFLLRRITNLSLSLFWLVASAWSSGAAMRTAISHAMSSILSLISSRRRKRCRSGTGAAARAARSSSHRRMAALLHPAAGLGPARAARAATGRSVHDRPPRCRPSE